MLAAFILKTTTKSSTQEELSLNDRHTMKSINERFQLALQGRVARVPCHLTRVVVLASIRTSHALLFPVCQGLLGLVFHLFALCYLGNSHSN